MKKVKIICLIMAVILVVPVFAGCGGSNKVAATVKIVFREPKDLTLSDVQLAERIKNGEKEEDLYTTLLEFEPTVEGTEKEPPTVLMAAEQVLQKYEKEYNLSKDGTYIAEVFNHKQVDTVDPEFGYYSYWACTINGDVSKDGRQSVTQIYQDDVIVFTWTSSKEPRQDTGAADTTDPNDDVTSEIPTDDTTVEIEDNNA